MTFLANGSFLFLRPKQNPPKISISVTKTQKPEIFFLFSQSFLLELEELNQEYEKILEKKAKNSEDFNEMVRLLQNLKKIVERELESTERELKSVVSKFN